MLDAQMKRGLLDSCVLSVLTKGDSYGYRIIRDMSPVMEVSESTLYPILRRLEAAGALRTYSVEHSGRLRKFYSITSAGHKLLEENLDGWKEIIRVYDFIKGENEGAGEDDEG